MNHQNAYLRLSVDSFKQAGESDLPEKQVIQSLAIKYGPILDNLNDAVFITDKMGKFIFANKSIEQRSGIPKGVFIGRHFLEIIEPKYHEYAQSFFQKAINGEDAVPAMEIEWVMPSGQKNIVEINWKILTEGNATAGFLAVCRDITDRKQAEEALNKAYDELEMRVLDRTKELKRANDSLQGQIRKRIRAEENLKKSEEKYRSLFENSGDAVFLFDIRTRNILDANQQAETLTGYYKKEIIGMHHSRLHPKKDAEYYEEKFRKHLEDDLVFDLEAEIQKKDGTFVPVFICKSQIDLNGKKVMQSICRDISKEKIISDLKNELSSKKLINRAKVLIANHYKINDKEALALLQKESRKQSRKLKDIANAVISSKFILD